MDRLALVVLTLVLLGRPALAADPATRFVYPGADGRLVYVPDARGDRVPDFSHAGYGGGAAIPDVPVRVVVPAAAGDSTARIQAAIDLVAALQAGRERLSRRGAVARRSARGRGPAADRCERGRSARAGQGNRSRRDRHRPPGADPRSTAGRIGSPKTNRVRWPTSTFPSARTPSGSIRPTGLKVGDTVVVEHPGTKEWIAAVGMDRFPSRDKGSYLDWRPGTVNVQWDRVVTKIDGDDDHPRRPADHRARCGARVVPPCGSTRGRGGRGRSASRTCGWNPRSTRTTRTTRITPGPGSRSRTRRTCGCGRCRSRTSRGRRSRCGSPRSGSPSKTAPPRSPVSEVGGYRRHTFFTAGQQTLFLRCTADDGRHDFAVGHLAAGPNAFVHCKATNAHRFSGPIGSWATRRPLRQRHDRRRRAGADQPRDGRPGRRLGRGELGALAVHAPRWSRAGCRRRRRTGRSASGVSSSATATGGS